MRLAIGLLASFGSLFTMCQNGPVPGNCCKSGDQLNVVVTQEDHPLQACNDWGGHLVIRNKIPICEDVDF